MTHKTTLLLSRGALKDALRLYCTAECHELGEPFKLTIDLDDVTDLHSVDEDNIDQIELEWEA